MVGDENDGADLFIEVTKDFDETYAEIQASPTIRPIPDRSGLSGDAPESASGDDGCPRGGSDRVHYQRSGGSWSSRNARVNAATSERNVDMSTATSSWNSRLCSSRTMSSRVRS